MQLKIAQVVGKSGGGGVQRVACNLATGLQAHGHDSTLVAVRDAGEVTAEDLQISRIIELGAVGSVKANAAAVYRLRRELSRGRYDVLHVHGQGCLPFVALSMLGIRKRPKLWFTWHNSESVLEEQGLRQNLMVRSMLQCDRVFGSSQRIVDQVETKLGSRMRSSPMVFRNGVPVTPASPTVGEATPTLLWMARLVPSKNPAMLLRAAANLRTEGLNFKVIIAGDPPARAMSFKQEMLELSRQLKVEDVVEFAGWIADPGPVICRSAIGVQTSDGEGLSMTLLEQMMSGLAVVATDVGDTARAIDHMRSGILIAKQDERALTESLGKLIADQGFRENIGAAARQKMLVEFSIDAMVKQAVEIYHLN